jgi:NAD(P)-dependent dehydrogenase (short-subunit alcohol dehydrogenase family)
MSMQRLSGRTALVTGAGSGIGRATSVAFAREGATVVAVDVSGDGLQGTRDLIEQQGGRMHGLSFDVTDEKAVAQGFEKAVSLAGGIDFAFNNAGITHAAAKTHEIALADWERVLRVNVIGVWLCMREELRRMQEVGAGVIVNTASFGSTHTLATLSAYTASKHAVLGLTKNAAVEYATLGIRINCIAPGGIPTGMMAQTMAGMTDAERDTAKAGIADLHPMKRLGEASEIADAVLFLCSKEASFITGACLPVDGGWGAI